MKTCKCGCGETFEPTRDWQEFYSVPCRLRYNNELRPVSETKRLGRTVARRKAKARRTQQVVASIDMPVGASERYLCPEGVYNLCAAIFESAYKEKDRLFFVENWSRFICDSLGVDPQDMIKCAWEQLT
jgi:hypothetical protein